MNCRALIFAIVLGIPMAGFSQNNSQQSPTFNKDVLPILQAHCQSCHRPGEIAPMSLLSYEDARPWAQSIRDKVSKRVMPPWHADPNYGPYSNDRRLSDGDIQTIVRWVDAGAPRGNLADAPPPRNFVDGWNIGKPDAVLTMTETYRVGASGTDDYIYFSVPTNFAEDRFVTAVEVRPGNRRTVHHVLAYVQKGGAGVPTRSNVERYNQVAGTQLFRAEGLAIRVNDDAPVEDDACGMPNGGSALSGDLTGGARPLIGVYVPGGNPFIFPTGVAQKIPAGSEILFQIHYSKTGKEEADRTSIGLVFSKEPPQSVMLTRWVQNYYFKIPANAPNHLVKGCYTFDQDADIVSFFPHMHTRGKDMEYKAIYPDGYSSVLFRVSSYDFNWQTSYILKSPLRIPKGTRIEVTAHYDNSQGNRKNANPATDVRWGDPTYDEMMIGGMNYVAAKPGK